jgi:hypothetical protein
MVKNGSEMADLRQKSRKAVALCEGFPMLTPMGTPPASSLSRSGVIISLRSMFLRVAAAHAFDGGFHSGEIPEVRLP